VDRKPNCYARRPDSDHAECALVFFMCDDLKVMRDKMTKSKCFHYVVVFGAIMVIFHVVSWIGQQKVNTRNASFPADTYFRYKNNSNIHHCITREVIGTRPLVHLADFRELRHHNESEDTKNRRASFKQIFDERIWEGNKEELRRAVHLQASGNYSVVMTR